MGIKYFFAVAFIGFVTFAKAQDQAAHYKVYDSETKKIISIDELVAKAKKADVLFFGEEHNDSIGHYLEAVIFQKFATANQNRVGLTMEMFHTDVQPIINEYLNGNISEKNFIKEARAWGNYKDYKPMVEFAKANKLNVIGGNAAARYSNTVTVKGLTALQDFPESSKEYFAPLPIDTATGRYLEKFNETLGGHSMGSMKVYQTQNFWDATMANSIAQFAKTHKGYKVFQVNGRFHSDEHLGTYAQLKRCAPKLKALNIACFSSDDFANPNWENHQNQGDFVILTDPKIRKSY